MTTEEEDVTAPSLILVVDDDAAILKLVRLELSAQGFGVLAAETGTEAIRFAEEYRPDLVVLDLMLPDMSGIEVMRRLRERTTTVSVIMLTAKGTDADKVRGLELGADDYVPKPFSPDELVARVNAVLRRARRLPGIRASIVRFRDVQVDLERRIVLRGDAVVPLTRTEWNLLQSLAENAGKVMLGTELLTRVWGPEYRNDVHYLRVWISRLRSKLEPGRPEPSLIRTFPGIGYMLEAPVPDETASFAAPVPA
jgi:two-component system KDP operon response regulator KdpE